MSYPNGLNEFLTQDTIEKTVNLSADEVTSSIAQVSGSLIGGGISNSSNGKLTINWDTGEAVFSDGARGRVFLGKIPGTEDYGIKIVDATGNIVISSDSQIQTAGIADDAVTAGKITISQLDALCINTGTLNVDETITVGINNITIDGVNKRIIVNDGTNDRVLIGYQDGGF